MHHDEFVHGTLMLLLLVSCLTFPVKRWTLMRINYADSRASAAEHITEEEWLKNKLDKRHANYDCENSLEKSF